MVFLVGPAPPVGVSVFYGGMVWLLPLVSSNVIVTCLVPSPRCGVGPVVVLVGPPRLCGAVCSTEIRYACCRLFAVMSSLRARYHTKKRCCSFLLANGATVPALMQFSAPVKKHWLGSFSIVLPPSGLSGPLGAGAARGPGGRGREGGRGSFEELLQFSGSGEPQDVELPNEPS